MARDQAMSTSATVVNQLGDKPEEVRKRLEEEKRQARERDRKPADQAASGARSEEPPGREGQVPTYEDEPDSA
ncbi:hypothetical protein NLX86_17325 [Streptomyces sp. A3M-1-3]|uniref:hypothetical protein n=1 Tax=Streptomyces sp. A3M-1-3 TaxID=2962044 RepID=UPI0020B897F8|nr:hypothetical protein [Streptomyces sp. A3M-1-3]MCP3819792.1 hypothetical protein [Streptomyces sp. A3M-1-3]